MTMLFCIAESEIKVIHTYIHTYIMNYLGSQTNDKFVISPMVYVVVKTVK